MSAEEGKRPFEARLAELRREAARTGRVEDPGVRAAGGPLPSAAGEQRPGYYGRPPLKPPVWTWEVPVYFFVGGLAGGCAVLAWAARLAGTDPALLRVALWLALGGTVLSAALLVMDLGRPARFLNMLRVFKRRSPMSVGVWVLTAFGAFLTLAVVGVELSRRGLQPPPAGPVLLALGTWGAAPLGAIVATYTGVLIGATAVPAWNLHRAVLPLHFGVAGLGSGAAALELLGFHLAPLWAVGVLAAAVETAAGLAVELSRHGAADRAVHEGRSGNVLRGAAVLSGPVSLLLRLTGLTSWAAATFLLGAFTSRFGWMEAGRASASDPEAALERYTG